MTTEPCSEPAEFWQPYTLTHPNQTQSRHHIHDLSLKRSHPYRIHSMHASCSSRLNSRFDYSDILHWAKRKNCDSFKFLCIPLTFFILDPKILFGNSFKNIDKITCIVTAWRTQVLPTICVKCEPGEDLPRSSLCYDIIILVARCWPQGSKCQYYSSR